MKISPERNLRNKLLATATVIGGLLISGCGESKQVVDKAPAPLAASTLPPTNTDNPRLNSLNAFRKKILTRHRARIALGTCVAWPNASGLLTVTYNPGVASLDVSRSQENGKREESYIFAAPDAATISGQIEMDGPPIDSSLVMPTIMPMQIPGQPPEITGVRSLSEGLIQDRNGQAYYTDIATGLPVMDTAIVFSSADNHPDPQVALSTCEALRDHHPIAGNAIAP